jgi:protein-S-isoprenylcysteine O-methyltransferase
MNYGLLLFSLGLALRAWSWWALSRAGLPREAFFTVQQPPDWTTNGPYRFLRHPAYLGSMLILSGIGMQVLGPPGLVLSAPAWPFFALRIHQENQLRGTGWL